MTIKWPENRTDESRPRRTPSRQLLGLALLALPLLLLGRVSYSGEGKAPTFHGDVERILQRHCQDCHRPGQVAPFSLLSYDQAPSVRRIS